MEARNIKIMKANILLLGLLFIVALSALPAWGQYYAYVTNAGEFEDGVNGDLSVVDLAANTVVATVPVGDFPQGVAVNPAGTAVYVANTASSEFTVIDTVTLMATTVPAGPGTTGVAIHPDGTRIYLSNPNWSGEGTSTVSVVDRATNTIIDEILCGNGSCGIQVHPAGKKAYVANAFDGTIAVFDTDTHKVIDTIFLETVGPNEPCVPVPLTIHPEGTYVYAANRAGPSFWAINTTTHEAIALPFGHSHVGIAVNPAGTAVYLPDFNDQNPDLPPQGTTVDVIDTKTLELITTIDGLDAPLDVSIHPDGTRVYITNTGNNTLSVIDATNNALITSVAVGSNPTGFGGCIGSGVPRLIKEAIVARLQAVKETIEGDIDGVISPQRALGHIETALVSGNLCLQADLWSVLDSEEVDPRRLHPALGTTVFSCEETIVNAILDATRRGWITNTELRAELLAIVDQAVRADRVLAAVAIDDAIVAGIDPEGIKKAQGILEKGDALVEEAKVRQQLDKKASLLSNAIGQYQNVWQAALDLVE